jgi:hypothetical protein
VNDLAIFAVQMVICPANGTEIVKRRGLYFNNPAQGAIREVLCW